MRRFLKRLFLFAAFPAVVAVVWTTFVVAMDRRSYVRALPLAEGETMVVCGDSQTKDALDPVRIPGLRNFSTAATTCDQDAMRLADVLDANPGKIRCVLLDVSPLKVNSSLARPVSELNASRVHALLHVYHFRDNRRPFGSVLALWRDVIFTRKFNEFRKSVLRGRPWKSSLVGGFDPARQKGFLDKKTAKRAYEDGKGKAARVNGCPPATPGLLLFRVLEEQVARVRASGAEPVITTMPLSAPLREAIDPVRRAAFTREVQALARRLGVIYLDYLDLDLPLECWHDCNHLNCTGAEMFSERFARDLRKFYFYGGLDSRPEMR